MINLFTAGIDYFGRCVEPAAQVNAIPRTWKTRAFIGKNMANRLPPWIL
jgi:hypothetical protein